MVSPPQKNLIFQPSIFRGKQAVSFREGQRYTHPLGPTENKPTWYTRHSPWSAGMVPFRRRAGVGHGSDAEAPRHRRRDAAGPGFHTAVAAGAGGVAADVAFQVPWVARIFQQQNGREGFFPYKCLMIGKWYYGDFMVIYHNLKYTLRLRIIVIQVKNGCISKLVVTFQICIKRNFQLNYDSWLLEKEQLLYIFAKYVSKHYLGGSFLDLLYKWTFPLANKFGGIISGVTTSKFFFFFFFFGGDVGRVPHLQDSLKTNRNFAAENLDGKGMMMHFLCLGILYPPYFQVL